MTGKVLSFYVGPWHLAIPLPLIKEITRRIDYTPVPGGPPEIAGLLNLRGQIVTIFDLPRLMAGKSNNTLTRKGRGGAACIILKANGNESQAGLLIDGAGDAWDVTADMCEPPPANLQGIDSGFVTEIIKTADDLMMLIDLQNICSLEKGGSNSGMV